MSLYARLNLISLSIIVTPLVVDEFCDWEINSINLGSFLILFYFGYDTDETITLLSFQIVFEFYF